MLIHALSFLLCLSSTFYLAPSLGFVLSSHVRCVTSDSYFSYSSRISLRPLSSLLPSFLFLGNTRLSSRRRHPPHQHHRVDHQLYLSIQRHQRHEHRHELILVDAVDEEVVLRCSSAMDSVFRRDDLMDGDDSYCFHRPQSGIYTNHACPCHTIHSIANRRSVQAYLIGRSSHTANQRGKRLFFPFGSISTVETQNLLRRPWLFVLRCDKCTTNQ